jgi:NAD(P)H-hydrate epimerase
LASRIRTITQWINNADVPVYSLDIPSGLTGDDGIAAEDAIRADVTIVFHRKKPAHVMEKAAPYLGEVVRVPIGI